MRFSLSCSLWSKPVSPTTLLALVAVCKRWERLLPSFVDEGILDNEDSAICSSYLCIMAGFDWQVTKNTQDFPWVVQIMCSLWVDIFADIMSFLKRFRVLNLLDAKCAFSRVSIPLVSRSHIARNQSHYEAILWWCGVVCLLSIFLYARYLRSSNRGAGAKGVIWDVTAPLFSWAGVVLLSRYELSCCSKMSQVLFLHKYPGCNFSFSLHAFFLVGWI